MTQEVRWERMFPDQLEAALAACPVVYFPYGLCEPHGPQNAVQQILRGGVLGGVEGDVVLLRLFDERLGLVALSFTIEFARFDERVPHGLQFGRFFRRRGCKSFAGCADNQTGDNKEIRRSVDADAR